MSNISASAERRRYKRYEITLQGRIGSANGRQSNCLVRDYCSGGFLVQQVRLDGAAATTDFKAGEPVRLDLNTPLAPGSGPVQIQAIVAWVKNDHLGLSLQKPSDTIVKALHRHERISQAKLAGETGSRAGGETRFLAKLRYVAQGILPTLLRSLLVDTEEALLKQADNVSSNNEQQKIFSDLSALEGFRQGDSLTRSILALALDPQSSKIEPDTSTRELSLVDTEEFERWLEASRVATTLNRQFSEKLNAIGSKLAGARSGTDTGVLVVPFEPQHFTDALKDFAKQLELSATSRCVMFDCAARVLSNKLDGFYSKLDAALDAMGAFPRRTEKSVGTSRAVLTPPAENADSVPGDRPQPSSAPVGAEKPKTPVGAIGSSLSGLDQGQIEALVTHGIQQREKLANELMGLVTDTPNMTESLALWLKQLSEPLVREAVSDRGFFQNKQHPLREIVDSLGHLQMFRPRPDRNSEDDPLRHQVSDLLQPIGQGQVDEATLRDIAAAVQKLAGDQSRHYQRNVERVARASEGRDRVRRVRNSVLAELNNRYCGHRVPKVALELLEVGWRAILELAWLNSTDARNRYIGHLQLYDTLVAKLGGDVFDRKSEDVEASRLFESIATELAAVAFDPFRKDAVETRLRAELIGPIRSHPELVEFPRLENESDESGSITPPVGISEKVWAQTLELCMSLKVSDRVCMPDAPDGKQEQRVAWIRDDRQLFVLVDYRGLRTRDIKLAELALCVLERRAELDHADGRLLSDRAVDIILARMEERLVYQAAHDSLTGLLNRQQFHALLEKTMAASGRPSNTGVLLWIDVDQFRLINDIHGYDTGDRLLVAMARKLEQVNGMEVIAGHLGGDRFALLLPDIGLNAGEHCARQICESVRTMSFEESGQVIGLSVSVGLVSISVGQDGFSRLLQAADSTLTVAKAEGGDKVHVYRADDPEITRHKESLHWVVQVDDALDCGDLQLRCQPIVPVLPDLGLLPHYEVLLGVSNGAAKPLPIAEFIHAAERYNRMRAVDRWVAQTVMEWISAHRELMPRLHGFAVNLSGQTASDPSFIKFIRQQFKRTNIDPSWISFEVTETAAVADLSHCAGIIHDLKALGCHIALDDFGSGQASYSYLKELPVDWLKIDGAFVRKIAADHGDYAVVKSINEIGHFMGKKTIAEYVENEEILGLISDIGVDFAQGYAISKPLLMSDLLET